MLKPTLCSTLLRTTFPFLILAGGIAPLSAQAGGLGSLFPGLPPACPPNTSCVPGTQPPVTPPGTCGPAPAGQTCALPGPAINTNASNPGLNVGAGNPINVMTGNKYQREVDMAPLPGVLGLEIVRHYNSSYSGEHHSTNLMGRGWKLSYETELSASGKTIQIVQADGTRLIFSRDERNPSLCASANPADGSVTVRKGKLGDEYVWRWTNGRELSFDSGGKLVQILAPGGQFVSLQHDARGLLVGVTDPQGRRLQLTYLDKKSAVAGDAYRGVQTITSPVGTFSYTYGSSAPKGADVAPRALLANLVKVTLPTGARYYHYENPQFPTYLTGISELTGPAGKAAWQRVATYGYDASGRGNLTVKGSPARLARGADGQLLSPPRLAAGSGIEQVTLEHGAGETTLTNSLGQKTVYRYAMVAGQYRLFEVRGAGCVTCGEANMHYDYDASGLLVQKIKLSVNGVPLSATRYGFDRQGRATSVSSVDYVAGKALPAQWRMRFEYAGQSSEPVRIARPSVVPGRELVTTIAYVERGAAQGMPAHIEERGFIPSLDGRTAVKEIDRTISYAYDGYGQRVSVDGPLPNAADPSPLNSDITRTVFDARTKMANRTEAPGGVVTEVLARDAALRPSVVRVTDGASVQTTTVRSNWRGQPEEIRTEIVQAGGQPVTRTLRYEYDSAGRLLAMTQPGELHTSFVYDVAGRVTGRTLPDGSRVALSIDSEGRKRRATLFDPLTGIEAERAAWGYDEQNRLSSTSGMIDGSTQFSYNDAGQVIALTNALGVDTRFEYAADGILASRTVAAGTPDAGTLRIAHDGRGEATAVLDANGAATARRFDDFGRVVAEMGSDRGETLYQHDRAGRMVARRDDTGVTTRYSYDVAGHLVAIGSAGEPALVRYRYEGAYLAEVHSASERTRFVRDGFGQVLQELRWVAAVDERDNRADGLRQASVTAPRGLRFITRNAYDDAGRMVQQTLPDGHKVDYVYASGKGALSAILFDGQPLVRDIVQSVGGGLTGYTMSNGVREQIRLDAQGRIAQLSAAAAAPASLWERVRAWFGAGNAARATLVYGQENRYDDAGRLVALARRQDGQSREERFDYDAQDRLTGFDAADGLRTRLAYDGAGNRRAETLSAAGAAQQASRNYLYAPGSNRLAGLGAFSGQDTALAGAAGKGSAAWIYHATGVPLAQLRMQHVASGATDASRRIVYNTAKRPVAVYEGGQLLARYHYNDRGERIAKTVYAAGSAPRTSYSLYMGQRLAAEADGAGNITAHYVYLYGKPVAKVVMRAPGVAQRSWWQSLTSLGGLIGHADAPTGQAEVYAIHGDHLGMPQVVTDAQQRVVWSGRSTPFGATLVRTGLQGGTDGKPFEMNLRLPGQVYDSETGLNQNYYRDYDPQVGRYLTPDPSGLEGGINPYLYVSNNPLTKVDPLGLYEEDVHYYITYFLARAAGVDPRMAYVIATGAQYIDNNPATYPLAPSYFDAAWDLLTDNAAVQNRLRSYHFTQTEADDKTTEMTERYKNPSNPQLTRLHNASDNAGTLGTECSKAVLFGEYLHAYEDTFAHRRYDNRPVAVNMGFGHMVYGHMPDHTYNEDQLFGHDWTQNQDRTLEMEHEVFDMLKSQWGTGQGPNVSFNDLVPLLTDFNKQHENGTDTHDFTDKTKKLDMLNTQFQKWEMDFVRVDGTHVPLNLYQAGAGQYSISQGANDRKDFLRYEADDVNHYKGDAFQKTDPNFWGVILP